MGQWKLITKELASHIPFTILGAISGIIIMVIIVFANAPREISNALFYTLHPIHVILSAMVTTAMYRIKGKGTFWKAILIGYTGSIGIATLSDAIIPYLGGSLLDVSMEFHLPFIETEISPLFKIAEWQVINGAALLGIAIGYWKPTTKFPHSGHVFLSTWASLFNFTAFGVADWISISLLPFVFLFLFLAVWFPCCLSDIVYPLLFIRKRQELS